MSVEKSNIEQIKDLEQFSKEIEAEKQSLLMKALKSDNPKDILGVSELMQSQQAKVPKAKSFLFDPYNLNSNLGYKDKPLRVSYETLRGMSRTPIIRSIIITRTEQVASFSGAQDDNSNIGWSIRKKRKLFSKKDEGITDVEKVEIEGLMDFIENGGVEKQRWNADNFESFLRKLVPDSLSFDQMTFEVRQTFGQKPYEFFATDGSTHRLADSYNNELVSGKPKQLVRGYAPFYVQLYQGLVRAEYYPWELCFGIRNPSTNIYNNGYGVSELEDMIKIVTWMLYGDSYNGKFFSQGSSPKGMIKMSGNIDEDRLAEFRAQWRAQVAGVENAWKIPVLQAENMDWIDLQKANKDMEFSNWQEYLIKLSCAMYKIDPSEIGFHLTGNNEGGTTYEGNNEYKLQYSKDKGLKPLLRFMESKLNRYVVGPKSNDKYEFYWTGLQDGEEDTTLDNDIKKIENFMGLKEMRRKYNLPDDLAVDDIILNPIWLQYKQGLMTGSPQSNQAIDNIFDPNGQQQAENQADGNNANGIENKNPFESDENPFAKSFENFMQTLSK